MTLGKPIEEFDGLRPKMYSLAYDDNCGPKTRRVEKHRAKGIAKAAARALTHSQFKAQLNLPQENFVTNRRLGSHLHKIYAIKACESPIIFLLPLTSFIFDDYFFNRKSINPLYLLFFLGGETRVVFIRQ